MNTVGEGGQKVHTWSYDIYNHGTVICSVVTMVCSSVWHKRRVRSCVSMWALCCGPQTPEGEGSVA